VGASPLWRDFDQSQQHSNLSHMTVEFSIIQQTFLASNLPSVPQPVILQ
jgi:hypothetical protein